MQLFPLLTSAISASSANSLACSNFSSRAVSLSPAVKLAHESFEVRANQKAPLRLRFKLISHFVYIILSFLLLCEHLYWCDQMQYLVNKVAYAQLIIVLFGGLIEPQGSARNVAAHKGGKE